jgi:hypothetical protein
MFLFGLLATAMGAGTAAAASDDSGRIVGSVSDSFGTPLRDALVQVVQAVHDGENFTSLRSDAGGFFKTAVLAPGVYRLQVSRQGYRSVSTTRFVVDDTRSVSLEIALHKFSDAVLRNDDPRNQGVRQVLRGISERRLIFRSSPGEDVDAESAEASADGFARGGAMRIASGSAKSEGYILRPQASQSGVSTNFAFTEPLGAHSRVILSGQVDTGAGAFWRLRNTYNYRPDKDRDYNISVGYGRMSGNQLVSDSIQSPANSLPPADGLETFAFSTEGTTRLFDLLSIRYGIDYARLHYGEDKSYFYPSLQILLTPAEGWSFETSLTSRRLSDAGSIMLPGGEVLNLAESTLLTMVGDRVSMSQVRHSEAVVRRELKPGASLELAFYQDYINGPGIPILVTALTPSGQRSCVVEMDEDRSRQKGVRLTAKHDVAENLTGSIIYIYGESQEISPVSTASGAAALATVAELEGNPEAFMRREYRHSVTGRIDAFVPSSGTNVIATVRWNSGNPLTALDWFSDKMDIGTNSANLEVRQILPLPAFLEVAGRWEVMFELRNALNQGRKRVATADGEIAFDRNPRSVRFGLNYTFR